jgi:hypothetical protein
MDHGTQRDMVKQPLVVRHGEGEVLRCLGADIKFLCGGESTGRTWSVSECVAPPEVGAPPHHQAWDEAYFVLDGEVLL